ncbi:MAG: Uma2 family endonuclease [Prevotellaceae bacterium]|jgi:Uma2 family endonuclease|nr:Uma2 family endonuclease [Prevotellaceae bacterium]
MSPKEYTPPELEENAADDVVAAEPAATYGAAAFQPDAGRQYTYADYLGWIDDVRRELINGFVCVMSAPWRKHARISSELFGVMHAYIKRHGGACEAYHAPFDVRLPVNGETADSKVRNVVQPDICVVCDLSKLDEKGCLGAPDLVVEITSPSSQKKDWVKKYNLYEQAGVKEYWIVEPDAGTITVFILQGSGKYDDGMTYSVKEVPYHMVPVHTLSGLTIDVRELFGS